MHASQPRRLRTRWYVIGAGALVLLVGSAAVLLRGHFGPVELALTNRGLDRAEVQLVLVTETTGDVLAEGRYLTIEAGETVDATIDQAGDFVLQLRIRTADGSIHGHTLRQYLGSGKSMAITVEIAEGQIVSARVRMGASGTFSDLEVESD